MATFPFTSSGTYTPAAGVTSVDVIIVGGGGGGGKHANGGGGGGGGGVRLVQGVAVTPGVGVTVTVGAGGAAQASASTNGNSGANSAFGAEVALGGAGGGGTLATAPSGGSGGGGVGGTVTAQAGGAGTAGQGFAGGTGSVQTASAMGGGGGGGGSAVGATGGFKVGGAGGPGLSLTAWTALLGGVFGGGGGGGTPGSTGSIASAGGAGGGGAGGNGATVAVAGTANLGGGGGGSSGSTGNGAAGGSGYVLVLVTEARLAGLVVQVPMVIDPATVSARLAGLVTQVAVRMPPPTPIDVVATPSSGQIALTWATPPSSPDEIDHYEVQLDNAALIAKAMGTSHTFTGLTDGVQYSAKVRSVHASGTTMGWIENVLTPPGTFSVNPFMDAPWNAGPEWLDQAVERWEPHPTFTGDGTPVVDQPDLVGPMRLEYHTLVVQGGATKQVDVGQLLAPNPPVAQRASANQSQGNTSAAGVMVGAPRLGLMPGTYRFKILMAGRGNVNSNNGWMWPDYTGGTVTRFAWTELFQSAGTTQNTGQPISVTNATARLVEARAQRGSPGAQASCSPNWDVTVDAHLFVVRGIIVVTAYTVLGIMVRNDIGGGNNNYIVGGSSITARKVA